MQSEGEEVRKKLRVRRGRGRAGGGGGRERWRMDDAREGGWQRAEAERESAREG